MRQSFAWWSYCNRGVDDFSLLKSAREIGYEGVELIGEQLFETALDLGFTITSHGGHTGIDCGLNDPANHDRIELEITANLSLALKYRIPNLIVFSGNRRSDLIDKEGIAHTVTGLKRVSRMAEDTGVNLVIELLNSKIDHPGYHCDHTAWAADVVREVDSPQVKILYDIYHMQIMEGDIVRTIQANSDLIAHYHTAGNPGRGPIGLTQEINYEPIFRTISETGYDGFVTHEFYPPANPVDALRDAYELTERAVSTPAPILNELL